MFFGRPGRCVGVMKPVDNLPSRWEPSVFFWGLDFRSSMRPR